MDKTFESGRGDRVARRPNRPREPTDEFHEAMIFAHDRAVNTGYRQRVWRDPANGWYLVSAINRKQRVTATIAE